MYEDEEDIVKACSGYGFRVYDLQIRKKLQYV